VHPEAVLRFDTSKPDGMPRKQLDVSRLHALGWQHRIELREGLQSCYRWLVDHENEALGAAGPHQQQPAPRPVGVGFGSDPPDAPES